MHEDRARALSFGSDPDLYDRMRPRYPAGLISDLVTRPGLDVLDVGCGTGIVAEAFAAAGCQVLGVEPDERMAAVARRKGLDVEIGTFEEWDARGRTFDLVVSGQAWHWVSPETGPAKAASVLRPGGRLAVFWNLGGHEPEMQAALDEVYERHAPQLKKTSTALGPVGSADRTAADLAAIGESGAFAEPEVRHYAWSARRTAAEWVETLPTHSNHRLLEPDVLAALLADVYAAIEERGGTIALVNDTLLVSAERLATTPPG